MSQAIPDPYEILQVSRHAELDVIEAAYRRLARKRHPDVNDSPDAHRQMQLLNWAYETLRDPVARARYDRNHPESRPSTATYWDRESVRPPVQPSGPAVDRDRPSPQSSDDRLGPEGMEPQQASSSKTWGVILGGLAILYVAWRLFGGGGTPSELTPTPTIEFADGSVFATMPLATPGPRPTRTPIIRKIATTHVMEELGQAGFKFRPDGTVGGHPAHRANYDYYTVMVLLVGEPDQLIQAEMMIFYNEMTQETPGFPHIIRALAPDWEDDFVTWVSETSGETTSSSHVDNLYFELTHFTSTEFGSGAKLTITVDY